MREGSFKMTALAYDINMFLYEARAAQETKTRRGVIQASRVG